MNLFIDTHLNDVSIVLHNGSEIIKVKVIEGVTENSKVIMPAIKKILNKKTPDSIIVVNGPGSFTGVRLGVTIAKTLAHTLNVPIRAISSLECLALSVLDEGDRIVSFSDNNGYYIGFFTAENKKFGNYEYVTNSEYEEFTEKYDVYEDLKLDFLRIINFALKKPTINPHELKPIYVKKLDVEK